MAYKSQIRQKIESILGDRRENSFSWVFIDTTSKTKKRYRMKLCTEVVASPKERKKILALPNVVKVSYMDSLCWGGVTVYFDKRPSQIKLKKK